MGRGLFVFSRIANALTVVLHAMALIAAFWLFRNESDRARMRLVFALGSLIGLGLCCSVLTYWQGDRIIMTTLPVWAILYPFLAHRVVASRRRRTVDRSAR